jgi:tetratricopeptide (TPR) repeat protein
MKFMKKNLRIVASVMASFIFALLLVQSYRHQRETDRRLAELQEALSERSFAAKPPPQASQPVIIVNEGTSGSDVVRKQQNLDEILAIGWRFVDAREPSEAAKAVAIFKEGIKNVDPTNPELYNGLGRAELIAGQPREALVTWQKGLELTPRIPDMQSGIGWAYWSLNDPYEAKEAWQRALSMNPHSPDAWSAMAWIDLACGKFTEAKTGFEELVRFDPSQKRWVIGLSMARADNADISQISWYFPLPPLSSFAQPLPTGAAHDQLHTTRILAYSPVSLDQSK